MKILKTNGYAARHQSDKLEKEMKVKRKRKKFKKRGRKNNQITHSMDIHSISLRIFFFGSNFFLFCHLVRYFSVCKDNEMQCNPSQFHLHWTVEVLQVPG